MKHYLYQTAALLLAGLLLVACEPATPPQTTADTPVTPAFQIATGIWRVTLQTAGGDLPFLLELQHDASGWRAWYLNGEERMPVEQVEVTDQTLTLVMPTLDSRLTAQLQTDGSLAGSVVLGVTRTPVSMALHAVHNQQYRFFEMLIAPQIDVSGRWAMTYTADGGEPQAFVAEFRQQGSQVEGTVLRPSGDMRYLAGVVRDDTLYLSTFDGSDARLFKARLDAEGVLHGEYWANGSSHAVWTAQRDADAALPDPTTMAQVKDDARFDFSFPNLAGEPVSLHDPQFAGKVVIVTLGGSWCINCHDEAEFLIPWYRDNAARGVEVMQLMFERVATRDQALVQARAFKEKFNTPYPVLLAAWGDTGIQDVLPELTGAFAFPTTIFIDKQGRVRKLHVGFSGPGTGAHYQALIAEFNTTVDALLAESTGATEVAE